MHFTLPHKNKKKTSVRHTFQTFITLSLRFLIFVNKRGVGGRYAVRVGGRETWGCWRTWHGGHCPTKEGDMQASDNIVRQAKDIIVGRGSPRPVLPEKTYVNCWKTRNVG